MRVQSKTPLAVYPEGIEVRLGKDLKGITLGWVPGEVTGRTSMQHS